MRRLLNPFRLSEHPVDADDENEVPQEPGKVSLEMFSESVLFAAVGLRTSFCNIR